MKMNKNETLGDMASRRFDELALHGNWNKWKKVNKIEKLEITINKTKKEKGKMRGRIEMVGERDFKNPTLSMNLLYP